MPGRQRRAMRETSAGGVVYRCTPHGQQFLLIKDAYQNWGFPKGHVASGERYEETARRETQEETGLDRLIPRGALGVVDWYFQFKGKRIHKYCHFFLFESPAGDPRPQVEEGITECRWYSREESLDAISYANAREMLEKAVELAPDPCDEASRQEAPGH